MGTTMRGDIVVLPFPFSDLSGSKRRPAMVVAVLKGEDIILCQITSVSREDSDAVAISENDMEIGSLSRMSYARPNRIFTADSRIIIYRAGHLHEAKSNEVIERIINIIRG